MSLKQIAVTARRELIFQYLQRQRRPAKLTAGSCGFFGNMFMTLNGMHLCRLAGVVPYPFWGQNCLYYDHAKGDNAWDYYFEQPGLMSYQPQELATFFKFLPDGGDPIRISSRKEIRHAYSQCIAENVVLKPHFVEALEKDLNDFPDLSNFIGVHVRQTDAALGRENRRVPSLDQYFHCIDSALEKGESVGIFLASDTDEVIESMTRRYGKRVFSIGCIRSEAGLSIHGHYDKGTSGSAFQKGVEVIRDAYLLAQTKMLIRTHSRVTAYSLCLNPDLEFINILGEVDHARLPWLGRGMQGG